MIINIEVGRIELAADREPLEIENFDKRGAKGTKPLLAELAHHPVYMDCGEPAHFGEIRLSETERETVPFAQSSRHQPRVGLAKEVRDPGNGVEPSETAEGHGAVEGGQAEQVARPLAGIEERE